MICLTTYWRPIDDPVATHKRTSDDVLTTRSRPLAIADNFMTMHWRPLATSWRPLASSWRIGDDTLATLRCVEDVVATSKWPPPDSWQNMTLNSNELIIWRWVVVGCGYKYSIPDTIWAHFLFMVKLSFKFVHQIKIMTSINTSSYTAGEAVDQCHWCKEFFGQSKNPNWSVLNRMDK